MSLLQRRVFIRRALQMKSLEIISGIDISAYPYCSIVELNQVWQLKRAVCSNVKPDIVDLEIVHLLRVYKYHGHLAAYTVTR